MRDVITDHATPADWHAARSASIGGSEVAAVLGVSPSTTPLDVWTRLREPALYRPPTGAHLDDGTRWEAVALQLYRPERGRLEVPRWRIARHACGWLHATPDGWIVDVDELVGLVEIKTVRGEWARNADGERVWVRPDPEAWPVDGTEIRDYGDDEAGPVPIWYWLQCQAQLACTGAPWVDLQAWFPQPMAMPTSRTIRIYPDRRWPSILGALTDWHARHIVGEEIPDPSSSEERERLARWRYPTGPASRRATADEEAMIRDALRATREEAAWADRAGAIRASLIESARGARLWSPSGDLTMGRSGPTVRAPRGRR